MNWLKTVMIEQGDIVDSLLKNQQAIWDICEHAPKSFVVTNSLLVVLGMKKVRNCEIVMEDTNDTTAI